MARKTSNTGVKISKSTKRVAADMLADATAATTTSAKRFSSIPAVAATKPAVATVVAAIPAAAIAAATPVATEKPACTEKSATAENTACTEKAACSEKTAANPQALHDLFNVDADVARDAAATLGSTHDSAAVDALIEVVSNTNGYFHSVVRSAAAASLASRLKSEVSRQKSGVSREERIITRPIRCAVAFAPRITFCLLPSSFCLHFFRGMGGCGFSVTAVGWGESTHPPVLSPCVSAATAQRRRVCSWVALSSDEACQWGAE